MLKVWNTRTSTLQCGMLVDKIKLDHYGGTISQTLRLACVLTSTLYYTIHVCMHTYVYSGAPLRSNP